MKELINLIKHIIFDMDGVLLDSEQAIRKACIRVMNLDITTEDDVFKPLTGTGDTNFVRGVAEDNGITYTDDLKQEVYKEISVIVKEESVVFPGVAEMLHTLKERGYTLAVASAADRVKVLINLDCMGLTEDFFRTVITGNDVAAQKPAPDCYIKVIETIGADPGECLVVEDAIKGLAAAHGAGALGAGVATTFTQEILKTEGKADYTIAQTVDLLELLDSIR